MQHIEKLIFVVYLATAYGASAIYKRDITLTNLPKNETAEMSKEVVMEYEPIRPSDLVESTQSNYEIGKAIAEVVTKAADIFTKMDLTDQGLKNLIQLIVSLVSLYFGPYAQVIVPMLSGIAVVVSKSLT